ncbi:hypothetical protein LTR37_008127 [Vermiconidia calcicola]|uniref:Uncharacterized protein n=1 Tax=Vermiconidia calcicola TaxID=1690605 RepID=A0ACC3NBW6_9PEZI|nr:hypothetical protein LTR37_008127 [Vermiconidia calcicola]
MLPRRTLRLLPRLRSSYSTTTDNPVPANNPKPEVAENQFTISSTNAIPTSSSGSHDGVLTETPEDGEKKRLLQAPNREGIWSRSQMPRAKAMIGPRFEQVIMEDQPRPLAAIDLIHQQPVRWMKERTVSCDGGGGPLGHPRIFINVDKPQICWCTYCGLPFAHESHRKFLASQPSTTFPLEPQGREAEVRNDPGDARTGQSVGYQTTTGQPYEQR